MGKIKRQILFIALGALIICLLAISKAHATCVSGEQSCSTNYAVGNVFFGSGGSLDTTCSTSFCAKQAVGETGIGLTNSPSYQAYAGFNVNREPSLQFIVNTTNVNLGVLSTTSTATATESFSIESYLAGGYTVETIGNPPQYGSHTLTALTSPSSPTAGTEQFGINLVTNTSPSSIGANPNTIPNSSYSDCTSANHYCIGSGYYTSNSYQYINNSSLVSSATSTGQVDFTISYIANISSVTPAGLYTMNQVLVALPNF